MASRRMRCSAEKPTPASGESSRSKSADAIGRASEPPDVLRYLLGGHGLRTRGLDDRPVRRHLCARLPSETFTRSGSPTNHSDAEVERSGHASLEAARTCDAPQRSARRCELGRRDRPVDALRSVRTVTRTPAGAVACSAPSNDNAPAACANRPEDVQNSIVSSASSWVSSAIVAAPVSAATTRPIEHASVVRALVAHHLVPALAEQIRLGEAAGEGLGENRHLAISDSRSSPGSAAARSSAAR